MQSRDVKREGEKRGVEMRWEERRGERAEKKEECSDPDVSQSIAK